MSSLGVDQIVKLLSASVGERAAREAVLSALSRLALPPQGLSQDDALRVLEAIAKTPGVLGISRKSPASSVKAR